MAGFHPLDLLRKDIPRLRSKGEFRLQDLKAQCENLHYPPEWFMDIEFGALVTWHDECHP